MLVHLFHRRRPRAFTSSDWRRRSQTQHVRFTWWLGMASIQCWKEENKTGLCIARYATEWGSRQETICWRWRQCWPVGRSLRSRRSSTCQALLKLNIRPIKSCYDCLFVHSSDAQKLRATCPFCCLHSRGRRQKSQEVQEAGRINKYEEWARMIEETEQQL